jgi:hypothetical protein
LRFGEELKKVNLPGPSMTAIERNIAKMTWMEVRDIDKADVALVLPVGSLEQHRPHPDHYNAPVQGLINTHANNGPPSLQSHRQMVSRYCTNDDIDWAKPS